MAAITRRGCSFGLKAEALLLALLLTACSAATSRTKDDMTLSTLVKIELLADPELANLRLDAKTAQGVVTLSGTVRSQADADKAVGLARRVKGVRGVKSELKVGGS